MPGELGGEREKYASGRHFEHLFTMNDGDGGAKSLV